MEPVLELRGITKRFPGVLANDHIDLSLKQGEIHALLGENGAGKTTLMNILYGLYQPDEGEILVRGKRIEVHSPSDAIAAGIGPAIGQRSYEVGPEFPAPFLEQAASNEDFFRAAPRDGHAFFDIKAYVARRLGAARVGEVRVLPCDTCAEESRFFSYRRSCHRGEADYGRGLSAIALEA